MRATSLCCLFLLFQACGSTQKDTKAPAEGARATDAPAVPKPWTDRFREPTLLIADEVRVEGPDGLLDHLATRMEASSHTKRERVTTDGFLQEFTLSPGAVPLEIRAYLDRYELVAMKRLVVLERPGPVDVVIIASGDVFLRDVASETAQRAPVLRIEGKIPR